MLPEFATQSHALPLNACEIHTTCGNNLPPARSQVGELQGSSLLLALPVSGFKSPLLGA